MLKTGRWEAEVKGKKPQKPTILGPYNQSFFGYFMSPKLKKDPKQNFQNILVFYFKLGQRKGLGLRELETFC